MATVGAVAQGNPSGTRSGLFSGPATVGAGATAEHLGQTPVGAAPAAPTTAAPPKHVTIGVNTWSPNPKPGSTTASGAPWTNPTPPLNPQSQRMFSLIAAQLTEYGLGNLATLTSGGAPGGWLWDMILDGVDTPEELMIAVEQTPDWQERFAVIVEQRRRIAAGAPGRAMTVSEVVNYEVEAAQVMFNAGLPAWFYDEPTDFQNLMLAGVTVPEVATRLGGAWDRVRNVAPEIHDAFESFYGVGQGDAAMVAFFLDPNRTIASLERASRVAYSAGMGTRYGIGLDKATAERIAQTPRTEAGIDEGLRQVAGMQTVFDRTFAERGELRSDTTGVAAVFEGDSQSQRDLERRVAGRRIIDQSTVGGALQTQEGLVGTRSQR